MVCFCPNRRVKLTFFEKFETFMVRYNKVICTFADTKRYRSTACGRFSAGLMNLITQRQHIKNQHNT